MPAANVPHYLGRVQRARRSRESYHYATVEPLIESNAGGTEWRGPVQDAQLRFPKRGLVHWHDAPPGLREGSLWQFTIDEIASDERADRPEHFQLQDPQEPIEVIDLRGWGDETALRSSITGDGIPLSPPPLARRILFWLASGFAVGPLLLRNGRAPGLWALDAPEAHRDAARMPVHRLSTAEASRVSIGAVRWFVSPRLDLGQSAGIQNWTPDSQVARSILGRLRKMDSDLVRAVGMTDHLFGEYLRHVEGGQMGSADPAIERARADRLRGVRDAIQGDLRLLEEAAQALLATASVREEVERRVQSTVEEEVRTREKGIASALSTGTEELSRLRRELDSKRAEGEEVDAALLEKRRELEAKIASFDQEVEARLAEISRRPEALFAEAAIMRAVLAPLLERVVPSKDGSVRSRIASAVSASPARDDSIAQLREAPALRGALAAQASAAGLSLHAMLGVHAVFVAGLVPVVTGERGYDLLRAYSAAVAGGRLHWICVGSSTMEPYDLLGRFDSATRQIVPSPSGLLEVLRDARESGRQHLVVLEGFNRAPTEAYLSPILQSAQANRTGDAARTIRIASAGLLSEDDPYRELARLAWPRNVVIGCLPSDGSVTLPVPASVWRFLAVLDADYRDSPLPSVSSGLPPPDLTEIAPELWAESVNSVQDGTGCKADAVIAMSGALALSTRDSNDASRVREVLCLNGLPDADATSLAVSSTLIPRSAVGEKEVEDGMRSTGVAVTGWKTILTEVTRLRS